MSVTHVHLRHAVRAGCRSRFGAKAVLIAARWSASRRSLILAFAHGQIWEIVIAMVLLGAGFGLAFSAMSNIIVDAVPSSQTGVASGMNANIRTIGGSIGAAVMASIVTAGALPGGLPKESGYTAGFAHAGRRAVLWPRWPACSSRTLNTRPRRPPARTGRDGPRRSWRSSPAAPSSGRLSRE